MSDRKPMQDFDDVRDYLTGLKDRICTAIENEDGGARFSGPSAIGNAQKDIRTDTVVVTLADNTKVRLRYVSCPFAPFLDTTKQNVCDGL